MGYRIMINEPQRLALLELVKTIDQSTLTDEDPLKYWVEMLEQLPQDEAEQPRCLHGFSL